jgi:hypothetical protein
MEFAGIFMLAVQIAFAVHAMRRGYPLFWVFIIVFVPLIGCLLYIIMVLIPEATQSRAARQGVKALRKAMDPGKELRLKQQALEAADTVSNRTALAQEYLKQGMLNEAIALYEGALTGMYRTDPDLLLGLSNALVGAGQFDRAKAALDTLFQANPEFDNADARLLRARVLAELDATGDALDAYAALLQSAPSAEVKCRYGLLLKRSGKTSLAAALFQEIVKDASRANQHSNRLNKEWVEIAKRELG